MFFYRMMNKLIAGSVPYLPKKIVWQFSKRYVAGETIDDALNIVQDLVDKGMRVTVDLLGEFISDLRQAEENTRTYLQMMERFSAKGVRASYSLKPTSFGLLLNAEACYQNIRSLVQKAAAIHSFVRIDMEDSSCTEIELRLYKRLHNEFPNHVAIVLQAYLKRTLQDIQNLTTDSSAPETINIRLCKGIYVESEKIAYKGYEEVRRHFLEDLEFMFKHNLFAAIATHDKYLVDCAIQLIEKLNVPHNRFEFQMLYGVTPLLRDELVAAGYPMRIYVPFGKDWFAYCTRRLKENPKIASDVVKALFVRQ